MTSSGVVLNPSYDLSHFTKTTMWCIALWNLSERSQFETLRGCRRGCHINLLSCNYISSTLAMHVIKQCNDRSPFAGAEFGKVDKTSS